MKKDRAVHHVSVTKYVSYATLFSKLRLRILSDAASVLLSLNYGIIHVDQS